MSRFYARKVDTNHADVRDAIRKVGASVLDTSKLGQDAPDMLVGWQGRTVAFEVKFGKRKETQGQKKRREAWRGDAWLVVTNPEDAVLQLVRAVTRA